MNQRDTRERLDRDQPVAEGETQYGHSTGHRREAVVEPNSMNDIILQGYGLQWHGRTHACDRGTRCRWVAPRPKLLVHALWGRGIPGPRALARVAALCTSATGC